MRLFDWFSKRATQSREPLYFFNSLGREKQLFTLPAPAQEVRMYNCGPTVYDRQHIGNLSAAVFADTIRRVLEINDYKVKQVINITDFGHLSGDNDGDADSGEDRMTKGLKREKKTLTMENMREFGTKYMNQYLEDIATLNVAVDKIKFPRASDCVPTMIAMIETLLEKGYAYQIKDGVYFDTARFPGYGALGGISDDQQEGAPYSAEASKGRRIAINTEKHNRHDFVIWKSSGSKSKLGWDSPWGMGFPGWHLECSAMINALLGKQIDIHTGGIEHIAIHHNNEIAQSEAVTGKRPLSRFWLHREHIRLEDTKISKSKGNTAYVSDVIEKGFHPLALRYWFLTSHYRTPSNFTWEALAGAQQAFMRLHEKMRTVRHEPVVEVPPRFKNTFMLRVNDDIDTAGAIALVWETLKDTSLTPADIRAILVEADSVLALGLASPDESIEKLLAAQDAIPTDTLPQNIRDLIGARETARTEKDWAKADELRVSLHEAGFKVKDTTDGQIIFKQ